MFVKRLLFISIVLLFTLSIFGCGTDNGDSDNGNGDVSNASDLWGPSLEGNPDMPKKGEVPYPSYPGASTFGSVGRQNNCTFIYLLTIDSPEEVFNFYQEHMAKEGWTAEETTEISYLEYLLWPEGGKKNDAQVGTIPSIQIFPIQAENHLMPEAKTQVQLLWILDE